MSPLCFVPSRALPSTLRPSIIQSTTKSWRPQVRSPFLRPARVNACAMSSGSSCATSEPRHIVLLSGGVESSTLLRVAALEGGSHVSALFFDYGQRAVSQELRACEAQCGDAGVSDFVRVDLRAVSSAFQKRCKERRHVPLHHRNVVLLSVALSLAGQEDAKRISVAVCKDDTGWYPSASTEFLRAFREVGRTLGDVGIEAPLEMMSKSEVVRRGEGVGVEWGSTWSCMIGRSDVHCGRCVQCRARRRAFGEAGVAEVEGFYMR